MMESERIISKIRITSVYLGKIGLEKSLKELAGERFYVRLITINEIQRQTRGFGDMILHSKAETDVML
jgi:hypothetical protein